MLNSSKTGRRASLALSLADNFLRPGDFPSTPSGVDYSLLGSRAFLLEQLFLAWKAPAIAAEGAIFANHPMARHDDRSRVRRASAGNSSHGFRLAERPRHLRVRARPATGNPLQFLPDAPLKRRRLQIERKVQPRLLAFGTLNNF